MGSSPVFFFFFLTFFPHLNLVFSFRFGTLEFFLPPSPPRFAVFLSFFHLLFSIFRESVERWSRAKGGGKGAFKVCVFGRGIVFLLG